MADFDASILTGRRQKLTASHTPAATDADATAPTIVQQLALTRSLTFAGMQNPAMDTCTSADDKSVGSLVNGDSFVALQTWRGVQKVSVADYPGHVGRLGADIVTPLVDLCTPTGLQRDPATRTLRVSQKRAQKSVDRSLHFLDSFLAHRQRESQPMSSLFGVVVGSPALDEMRRSAELTAARPVDGFVIEGITSEWVRSDLHGEYFMEIIRRLPADKPRMAMGTKSLKDVFVAVDNGVDILDTHWVQQLAENNQSLSISDTQYKIDHGQDDQFRRDMGVLASGCECASCSAGYSRAYIHHLLTAREILGTVLLASHNLYQFGAFLQRLRKSILDGTYEVFRQQLIGK